MHPDTKNPEIKKFDEILGMIIDVCEKYGSRHLKEEEAEELWLSSIGEIYRIKKEQIDDNKNPAEQEDLQNFKVFLL